MDFGGGSFENEVPFDAAMPEISTSPQNKSENGRKSAEKSISIDLDAGKADF